MIYFFYLYIFYYKYIDQFNYLLFILGISIFGSYAITLLIK